MSVRVRFAPSPTGPLHIGGVRTALYNYLFAKSRGGTFIIRVEDTDKNRLVPGAEQYMLDSLAWCGIRYDEGPGTGGNYGPYRQSDRMEIYFPFVEKLLKSGHAYYAFDTPEELDAMRTLLKTSGSTSLQYDSVSRNSMCNSLTLTEEETNKRIAAGAPYVIRARIPANEELRFTDLIRGEVAVNTNELDDKVLFKSDGMPTYHLANVVDDYLMKITHVIRGEEWLPSAPLHHLLYTFFGWEAERPQFAHLPLILRPDGNGKLSKRDGDRLGFPVFPLNWTDPVSGELSIGFRERGFLPEAFLNMLALIGWAPHDGKEILSTDELIKDFSIDRIHKAGARFDFEKAKWFNHEYIKQKDGTELSALIRAGMEEKGVQASQEDLALVCETLKVRCTFVTELQQQALQIFIAPDAYDESVIKAKWHADSAGHFTLLRDGLMAIKDHSFKAIDDFLHSFLKSNNLKAGDILPLLRVMLIGSRNGPAVFEIISLVGPLESGQRIEKAVLTFNNK